LSTFACATVDRTNAMCANPSIARSSKYRASPRRMRGSSTRLTGLPRMDPETAMSRDSTSRARVRIPAGQAPDDLLELLDGLPDDVSERPVPRRAARAHG